MTKSKNAKKSPFNKQIKTRQAGFGAAQVIVTLAVGALVLVGGAGIFKYIEQQKANNDMEEMSDIRAGLIDFASKHNTSFATFTLDWGCKQQVFPSSRCWGTGASTQITNAWGGQYSFSAVAVTGGTNNGARIGTALVPDASCIKEITYQWDQYAKIEVGSTTVKATPTTPIDDTAINNACTGGSNTVYWTVKA